MPGMHNNIMIIVNVNIIASSAKAVINVAVTVNTNKTVSNTKK